MYVCTYMHVCKYMHVCMYMYVYVCISVYSYMYVYQYMHVYVSISDTGFEIYIHIHTYTYNTCIYVYTYNIHTVCILQYIWTIYVHIWYPISYTDIYWHSGSLMARIQSALNQVDQAVHLKGSMHHEMWGTWNSTQANKIYAKCLTDYSKRFEWRRLQYQELMADRNMDSSRYHGHIVLRYRFSTCASYTLEWYKLTPGQFTSASCGIRATSNRILLIQQDRATARIDGSLARDEDGGHHRQWWQTSPDRGVNCARPCRRRRLFFLLSH